MRRNIHHKDLPSLNSTHPSSTKKEMQSKKARLAHTRDTSDSGISSSSDSVSTRKRRLHANRHLQHRITYTTSCTTYAQVARDQVGTSALAMRPPEDLSEITPLEPTWRAHSAVQIEMYSLRNELLQMHHSMHDHQAAQEMLQETVPNMQQDTEEIKGNLLLMMDMYGNYILTSPYCNLSILFIPFQMVL